MPPTADAIESTSDIFSSLLVLFGLKFANKPADKYHPYGHGRLEPLVTMITVGFLVASATVIAYQGIENVFTPHKLPNVYTALLIHLPTSAIHPSETTFLPFRK